jgi:hypothetical protein
MPKGALKGAESVQIQIALAGKQVQAMKRRCRMRKRERLQQQRRLAFLGEMVQNMDCWVPSTQ